MAAWEVVTAESRVIARFDHTPYLHQWALSLAEAVGGVVEFAADDVPELIAGTTAALDGLTAVSA